MKYDKIKTAWNAQADEHNQWDELGEDEKVEWAARFGAATERAARQKAQEEVVSLKERIARAGVEHRRALHEALQQEREALEKWLLIKPCGAAHDFGWEAWKSRAALAATTEAAPENIREGSPYDNPAFEQLARDLGVWGTAQAALCAQFWLAAIRARTT